MAAAFLALNDVFGPVFTVDQAEAADPEVVLARAEGLKHQFIFDAQTHFVRDDFMHEEALGLRKFAGTHWNLQTRHSIRTTRNCGWSSSKTT